MPTIVQFRRGTEAQSDAFTGNVGELSVDTTNETVRVHDGSTAGGSRLATHAEVSDRLQVANATSLFVNVSGDTMSGALAMGTNKITGMGDPIADQDAATKTYVDTAVANIVDTAPEALNTLNELAAALGDDANFATTTATALSQKLGATASVTLSGDVTGAASFSANAVSITTDIAASGTPTGTFGSASQVPVITVGADGRITNISNTNVAGVTGFTYTAANNTFAITTADGGSFTSSIDELDNYALQSSLGTAATLDVGTTASKIVQLDGSARLPAVDGSQLTGISAGATVTDKTDDVNYNIVFTSETSGTQSLAGIDNTAFTFNPSTGTCNATTFNSTSDKNLKKNIKTINDSLSKVAQLRGVNFDWKKNSIKSMGVIAQEVEVIVPEVVSIDEGDQKSVNYGALVGLLIEAVKDLKNEVDELKANK